MARIGKISVIKKDYSHAFPTLETSLGLAGFTQFPGTRKRFTPDKKADGSYKTGLTAKLQKELEDKLEIDLSPKADFWNVAKPSKDGAVKVNSVTLMDGDNFFDLDDPLQAITYYWLGAHRFIAKSLEAYERGDYPAETQFYVADENYEDEMKYKKAKELNDAIILFDNYPVEKRKKIVRLMGIPITDDTKETTVYNHFDNFIKAKTVHSGPYQGMTPINVFKMFAGETDELIEIKDLVQKVIDHQVLRIGKGGAIFEGEERLYSDRDDLITTLSSDKNQDIRISLEKKLKAKMLSAV